MKTKISLTMIGKSDITDLSNGFGQTVLESFEFETNFADEYGYGEAFASTIQRIMDASNYPRKIWILANLLGGFSDDKDNLDCEKELIEKAQEVMDVWRKNDENIDAIIRKNIEKSS